MIADRVLASVPTPAFVVEEAAVRKNLEALARVKEEAGCKILLALKAFAMWRLAPLVSEYLDGVNAASIHEARLGVEEFRGEVHLCAPAYSEAVIREYIELKRAAGDRPFHLVMNSKNQWERWSKAARDAGIHAGLRLNPGVSVAEKPVYDPCRPGSRLGATPEEVAALDEASLAGLDGLHFHALCEQNSTHLARVIDGFEKRAAGLLPRVAYVNMGGGHHLTRQKSLHPELPIDDQYDLDFLVRLVREFKERHGVAVYLEPGEAVALGAGVLASTVLDIIHRDMPIGVLDASAAAHMPDIIEGPYQPPVRGATALGFGCPANSPPHAIRLTGPSCLAGDDMGAYAFDRELAPGDRVVFLDQAHYTMVKTNTFNGIALPRILLLAETGELETVAEFGYDDFKNRLS